MKDLVSIITPVYNSEKYILDTINSVLDQTYQEWEMLIVDDCSTDATTRLVEDVKDSRIQYIRLTHNMGAARARNVAIKKAKGNYIAFLDADDIWKKDKLQQQLTFMSQNNIGFSFTGYEIIKNNGNKVIHVPAKLNYSGFMKNTIIGTLTVMIDKRIIGEFELVDVKKDHDSMTWAKLLREGNIAYGLDLDLAYYRKVKGSISNNKFRAIKTHWTNCRKIEKLSLFKSLYFFVFYILNAIKKHYF